MDEVFGEANFLAQIVVNLNAKGRQLVAASRRPQYLLAYAKDGAACVLDAEQHRDGERERLPADRERRAALPAPPLRNTNKKFNPTTARTCATVWGNPRPARCARVRRRPGDRAGVRRRRAAVWRWSRRSSTSARRPGLPGREGRARRAVDVFQKDWLHPGRRKKLRTIWLAEEIGSTDTAVAELKEIVGHVFESPKPTGLLRRILSTMPDDILVLDFFAGSGTTATPSRCRTPRTAAPAAVGINSAEPTRDGSNARNAGC